MNFLTNTGVCGGAPVIDMIEPDTPTPFTDLIDRVRQGGGRVEGRLPVSEQSWMDMGQLEELDNMRRRLGQQWKKRAMPKGASQDSMKQGWSEKRTLAVTALLCAEWYARCMWRWVYGPSVPIR